MTTELNLIAALSHNLAEPLTVAQKEALQRAVTKIVCAGRARRSQSRPEDSVAGVGSDSRRAAGVPGGSIRRSCLQRSNLVLKF